MLARRLRSAARKPEPDIRRRRLLGAIGAAVLVATRVRGSAIAAGGAACGASDSGALRTSRRCRHRAGGHVGSSPPSYGRCGLRPSRQTGSISLVPADRKCLDLARLVVRHRARSGTRGRQATVRRHARHRGRICILVQRRKHHARARLGVGVDIDRRLFARNDLFGAVSRRHAVRQLGAAIGRRRNDLGRAGVRLDDRRLAAAGRPDISAIGERGARTHHRQRDDGNDSGETAAAL